MRKFEFYFECAIRTGNTWEISYKIRLQGKLMHLLFMSFSNFYVRVFSDVLLNIDDAFYWGIVMHILL
jgi:hypothetical protein